jgi:transaldolase
MTSNLLEQLREMSVVVADTGDLAAIETFQPRDATTNPSLITTAAQMPRYRSIVDDTLTNSRHTLGKDAPAARVAAHALDRVAVAFGVKILELVPGRVSTEVDARLSHDTEGTIAKAREIAALYKAHGVPTGRVLVKIASTWEGIQAAATLEKEGIRCNLTLLFGLHQAIACAEAGVTLVSPFVGRILDWYKKETGRAAYPPEEDPGVLSVTEIYNYFKKFGYRTEIMGASFRNIGQILKLAGCDLLTISPPLMAELQSTTGTLRRALDPERAATTPMARVAMDRAAFDQLHADDRMATEKLAEGIEGFSKALEMLEAFLVNRLTRLEGNGTVDRAVTELFKLYDGNGDGVLSREEWAGTDAVFDALDTDRDGLVTVEELTRGIGARYYAAAID